MKIKVFSHYTTDNNYKGDGPNWYSGSDVNYSLKEHTKDYLKDMGYTVTTTSKEINIAKNYLEQLVYKCGGYAHRLAKELYNIEESHLKRCNELLKQINEEL